MKQTSLTSTKNLVRIAMLAAVGTVLYFVAEIPIIPGAEHLKIDLSTVPALIGSIVITPLAGVVVLLIQNVIHLLKSTTLGIGELMNFLVGSVLVLSFSWSFSRARRRFSLPVAYLLTTLAVAVATILMGIVSNAVFFPVYMALMGRPQLPLGAFIAYLGGTVTLNLVKSLVTLLPVALVIKALERYRIESHS